MKRFKTQVKPNSVKILLAGIIVLILVNILARFNVVDLSMYYVNIMTIVLALFLLTEVSIMQLVQRRKKLTIMKTFGAIVAVLAFIGGIIGLFGVTVTIFMGVQTFVDIALLVFVVYEIFW